VTPTGPGTIRTSVSVPAGGDYTAWLNGVLLRHVELSIDGKRVGTVGESGSLYAPLGNVHLTPGVHQVTLRYGSPALAPGSSAPIYPIGPLALAPAGASTQVAYLDPTSATTLCGRSLDWLEVVTR
jgi:hypothetical protein